jgi:hypothetical protein
LARLSEVPTPRAAGSFLLAVVLVANLAFALTVVPPRVLFGPEPITQIDYALHFSRTVAADAFLTRSGRAWGYDPYFMAGYPMGTVFDVNTKFLQVVVAQLHRTGMSLPTAFNLFVFVSVLLPALMTWLAARNFRAPPIESALSAGIALCVYVLDPEVAKTWRLGVITSGIAMYTLPLALSFVYRFIEERRLGWYVAVVASGILMSLLHPLSFLLFYIPLAIYLAIRAGWTDWVLWSALLVMAVGSLAANAFWFVPVLANLRFKTYSGYHWVGNLAALRTDVIGLKGGLRLVVAALASVGLVAWWRAGRREAVKLLLFSILALTALGYLGGEFPLARQIQTYRCNLIAAFLLSVPAGTGVLQVIARIRAAAPSAARWGGRVAIALALAPVIVPTFGISHPNLDRLNRLALVGPMSTPSQDDRAVVAWLRANVRAERRVMIERWQLGAIVPWRTGLEVIGGPYPLVWLQHNFTNFAFLSALELPEEVRLFGRRLEDFTPEQLRAYLDTYNVGWVIAFTPESIETFERASWLRPVARVGRHRIFESADPTTAFLKGTGSVRVEYGAIHVTNASRGELVLKYHWAPFLTAEPPQEIVPQTVLDDPVPFIRLPANSVSDFVITDGAVVRPRG